MLAARRLRLSMFVSWDLFIEAIPVVLSIDVDFRIDLFPGLGAMMLR